MNWFGPSGDCGCCEECDGCPELLDYNYAARLCLAFRGSIFGLDASENSDNEDFVDTVNADVGVTLFTDWPDYVDVDSNGIPVSSKEFLITYDSPNELIFWTTDGPDEVNESVYKVTVSKINSIFELFYEESDDPPCPPKLGWVLEMEYRGEYVRGPDDTKGWSAFTRHVAHGPGAAFFTGGRPDRGGGSTYGEELTGCHAKLVDGRGGLSHISNSLIGGDRFHTPFDIDNVYQPIDMESGTVTTPACP